MRENPFTIVYGALWDLALTNENLGHMVKVSNRIRFDSEKDHSPIKEVANVADLPELTLIQSTATANVHETSCGAKVLRTYTFIINTGDYRLSAICSQVEWALFCALCNFKAVLMELKWHDVYFVKNINVTSIASGESDQRRNRGIRGWSAAWGCEVEMHLPKTEILAELPLCRS